MATQYTSEKDVQRAILQRAQASPAETPSLSRRETLEETDLVTPDTAEDGTVPPPPAYGDIYGEIHNDKDGLGTSASVTDDGRVNIRINQLNRRLSQVFTPALRQHLQEAQDSHEPPAYIPPSLGGNSPPPLNIVIQVVGSRGDVQPFVALGKVLKTYGHRIRLATHPNFKDFVEEHDLEFFSIGGDPSHLMAFMVKNPGLMPSFRSVFSGDVGQQRRNVAEYIQGCWRSCYQAGDGLDGDDNEAKPFVADCIIANPPSFAHIHCAEKLGVPLHIMFTMPWSPTQAFPHPLANIQSNADPQLTNYISYAMMELLSWQGLGDIINRFRKKCLALDPVSLIWGPGMLQRLKVPHTYCWSPALMSKPKDWGPHISISGFYLLASQNYCSDPELKAFLDAGPPPVYIGFGSIVLDDPDAMTQLIFEAVRRTGQRVLLSKGWGGIGAYNLPDGVFMLGNVPHDWLFQHVSCVVHHGGAGTTAAGLIAGRPTVVAPFFGDQPFWGAMVAQAGAGLSIPHKRLTAAKLVDAIGFCLKAETLARARELASKIASEQGTQNGAQSFHQYLEPDRLRCTLAPSRAATWRIRKTKIRLSAFAACTLANAGLLNFNDLKLFRAQEYYTDEGPWDPISGGFGSFVQAFNGMFMGLVELPSESWKAVGLPTGSSNRRESQASGSKKGKLRKSESSSLPSPAQSQTSLNSQQPPSRPGLSRQSTTTSFKDGASIRSNRTENSDMLRPRGAHTSKGMGRFVRTLVQAPMEITVSLTKGAHNVPKLWGDDTVRPQERITDMKSGMQAVGREWGYGWYYGLTGLVTQPWQGAQKEGAAGFAKGIGKGIGGFVAKPTAALVGTLGYTMKGVHKEVQKAFGSNVQSYIMASRAAQGYEEWMKSSEEEKQEVIERWRLVQTYMKKTKGDPEKMMRDVLERHDRMGREPSAQRAGGMDAERPETESTVAPVNDPETRYSFDTGPEEELEVQDQYHETTQERGTRIQAINQTTSQLPHQELRRKPVPQLKQADLERPSSTISSEYESDTMGLNESEDEEFERARRISQERNDQGHLEGTTQTGFETRQQGEKTTQERTEEDIVMEYIKKQSLMETHHRGKNRATSSEEDQYDEDLRRALEMSMQSAKRGYGYGQASRS